MTNTLPLSPEESAKVSQLMASDRARMDALTRYGHEAANGTVRIPNETRRFPAYRTSDGHVEAWTGERWIPVTAPRMLGTFSTVFSLGERTRPEYGIGSI